MKSLCLAFLAAALAACGDSSAIQPGPVTSITVAPFVLSPAFSPDIHDYTIRCASGVNSFTLAVTDTQGTETIAVDLAEDELFGIREQYWIRCLPDDFPQIAITHPSAGRPTPGYYLVNAATYAIALDTNGTPVWYARGARVINVDSQAQNTISWMPQTQANSPYNESSDSDFEVHSLATGATTIVRASGNPTDAHEFRMLPDGHFMVLSYPIEQHVDLEGLSNFSDDEFMADCQVQELDSSGNLVWSWLASQHVDPKTESLEPQTNTVSGNTVRDPFHCNSIDVDSSGNVLVSIRHANAVLYIDKTSGKVLWKLGGTPTNSDGARYIQIVGDSQGAFNMQHDARFRPNGNVSLYDDHGAPNGTGVARGVEYAIDNQANTATPVFQYLGTEQAQFEGSFRRYDDGESVIGWGGDMPDARILTEVDAVGNDVLDITFTPNPAPYRAVKVPLESLDIALLRATAAK